MKTIEVDDQLYQYIAGNTKSIGESASDILRRLLGVEDISSSEKKVEKQQETSKLNLKTKINNEQVLSEVVTDQVVQPQPETVAIPDKSDETSEVTSKVSKTSCQNVFDVINKEELATQKGAVGRFLLILSNLYRVHSNCFDVILDIRGRNRLYFAKTENELLESGSSTKPKRIPDTQFWVMTNSNTTKKKLMLTDVTNALGYSAAETEKIRDFL